MSKFNSTVKNNRTKNFAGGEAFKQNDKMQLISLLFTSFVKDKFYTSADQELEKLKQLVSTIPDKKFVAKTAIYTRNEFGMRSISHATASYLAPYLSGTSWGSSFFRKIIRRPDDITEILSHYSSHSGTKITNAMRKGFAKALEEFDEYKLAKYQGKNKAISLVDAVRLVHPKNTEAIKGLVYGTIKPANTWETRLTQAGQNAKTEEEKDHLKQKAWKDLILSGDIGYFALLRNIRNILETDNETIDEALKLLQDEKRIKNSLVLPFRYQTAIDAITEVNSERTRDALIAISNACEISLSNAPVFDGKTLVALDASASMRGKPITIGSLFAAVLYKTNNADLMLFHDNAQYITLNPQDSLGSLQRQIIQETNYGGTNFHAIFQEANKAYDRIIILSDMQGWMGFNAPTSSFQAYKDRLETNPKIYSFDLNGYGSLQFPEQNVYEIAGWSDKVFDLVKMMEEDKNAIINKIESIDL
jgi:hypothetical protein